MNTINTLTDRVKIVMENEGLNPSIFADTIGVQRPSLSHILSGRNKPSIDIIQKIINTLPQYNTTWLINGTGNMLQLDMFESEDDLRKNQQEKKTSSKAKPYKSKFANRNVNFVKEAIESNILDDENVVIASPISINEKQEPLVENKVEQPIDSDDSAKNTVLTQFDLEDTQQPIIMEKDVYVKQQINTQENTTSTPINTIASAPIVPAMFTSNKKIEKIIVFYDDKTFSVYNPE